MAEIRVSTLCQYLTNHGGQVGYGQANFEIPSEETSLGVGAKGVCMSSGKNCTHKCKDVEIVAGTVYLQPESNADAVVIKPTPHIKP